MTLSLLFAALQGGQLLVVDDDETPGSSFVEISDALDAAGPDDTILVRAGVYGPFDIFDRGARIFGVGDERPIVLGSVKIAGQELGESVVVDGLRIVHAGVGLAVDDSQGAVWLEDLSVEVTPQGSIPLPAIVIEDAAAVVMTEVRGVPALGPAGMGTWGALVGDSVVHIYDSQFRGSPAASPVALPGMKVEGSFVFASGSSFIGADGLPATDGRDGCAPGGDGQPGLIAAASPLIASEVLVVDCLFQGGAGGAGLGDCRPGADGPPVAVESRSTVETLDLVLPARSYDVTPVQFPGQPVQATFTGSPGEVVANYLGIQPNPLYFAAFGGSFGAFGSILVFEAGVLGPTGTLTVNLFGSVPAGYEFVALYGQGIFVSEEDGIVLGPPRAVLLATLPSIE